MANFAPQKDKTPPVTSPGAFFSVIAAAAARHRRLQAATVSLQTNTGLLVVLGVVTAIAGFTRGALRGLVRSRLRGLRGDRHCRILRPGQQPRARYEQRYDEHAV